MAPEVAKAGTEAVKAWAEAEVEGEAVEAGSKAETEGDLGEAMAAAATATAAAVTAAAVRAARGCRGRSRTHHRFAWRVGDRLGMRARRTGRWWATRSAT